MTLKELIDNGLPLNRKERFFTGTVFPMIVCRDNFKHFTLFTSLIKGCEGLEIIAKPSSANIQFFTEYSLVESIYTASSKRKFTDHPKSKDTPDIIILISNNRSKILIVVEAKMYDAPDSVSLTTQIANQKKHIDYLAKKLNIDKAIQCLLLPEKLSAQIDYLGVQVITWEKIYDTYKDILQDDYFLELLKIALDSYDELVAERRQYGKNCERKMRGEEIYNAYKSRQLDMVIMGRYMGKKGDYLLRDIESGQWRNQQYETSSEKVLFNDNWFYVKDFVELVDRIGN